MPVTELSIISSEVFPRSLMSSIKEVVFARISSILTKANQKQYENSFPTFLNLSGAVKVSLVK